jgi:hypothetical protein
MLTLSSKNNIQIQLSVDSMGLNDKKKTVEVHTPAPFISDQTAVLILNKFVFFLFVLFIIFINFFFLILFPYLIQEPLSIDN